MLLTSRADTPEGYGMTTALFFYMTSTIEGVARQACNDDSEEVDGYPVS